MVESFLADVAYIHGRAFPHGFEALKHLNVARTVVFFFYFCHVRLISSWSAQPAVMSGRTAPKSIQNYKKISIPLSPPCENLAENLNGV